MTKNIKLLEILFMFVWTLTVDAHYYNNVRVNDTPVRCLAQTDNELIWLGTGNGLYCYDGYRAIPKHGLSNSMRTTQTDSTSTTLLREFTISLCNCERK